MLNWVGINLYLVNRCLLIKYYQLKVLTAMSLLASLDGLAAFPHLLSANHKSTHPYLNCSSEENVEVDHFSNFEKF
jgi:hypothetical protein